MSRQQLQFDSNMSNIEEDDYFAEDDDNEVFYYNGRKSSASTSSSSCSNNFNPNFYNPFEIKHRRRTSRGQFKILEKAFANNPKPNAKARQVLAETLSMSPRGVQVWFQNRRAKAKQQQESSRKSHDNIVNDLQVSSSSPIILSSSGMIHSRSQSSSSSSSSNTTYSATPKNEIHVMISSSASLPLPPPPQPQVWYNNSNHSDAASTVTITSSSPLLLTPLQPQLEFKNEQQQQDDYCLWVDNVLNGHQTFFNNQHMPTAVISDVAHHIMKSDPFTTTTGTTNPAAANAVDHQLNAWAYIDSLQINDYQQNGKSVLETTSTTKMNNNMVNYNRHITDWITSTKAACRNNGIVDDDLLFMLDSSNSHYLQQHHQQQAKVTKSPSTIALVDNSGRHSYPLMPFEQEKSCWTGHQINRRLSEPTSHQSSELELGNSYNHYSAINIASTL